MGRIDQSDESVILLENFEKESEKLANSFWMSYMDYPVCVIDDDGFLPEKVHSVYGDFLGDFKENKDLLQRPLFFNEVPVPERWEIQGTNANAAVYDKSHKRASIFYTKEKHLRNIKIVDWMNEKGLVRFSDHYNKYGALFARTTFNAKGQKVNKSYFDAFGKEKIVENYVTGDIILNDGKKVRIFHNKTEFIIYYLQEKGWGKARLIFNTLSVPFFVSEEMGGRPKDILFWQEGERADIPGNMQMILEGRSNTGHIYVQNRKAYNKLMELGASNQYISQKGFAYPFVRDNSLGKDVLICTNSDQIEELAKLVEGLPQMNFHICALTEMSAKLLKFGTYSNVYLYPNVRMKRVDQLFKLCDYYLDINEGAEIVDAVYQAFLHNQWILAFDKTAHNRQFVEDASIFKLEQVDQMILQLKECLEDEWKLKSQLEKQKEHALWERDFTLI